MRRLLALRRQSALHQRLRRQVHQADDRPCSQVVQPLLSGIFPRQKPEGIGRQSWTYGAPAANVDQNDYQQQDQPGDEDHHLQEIGERNRPEAADRGVNENNESATDYPDDQGRPCQGLENEAEGHEHRANPGDVGKKYGCCNGHRCNLAITLCHIVGDREYTEAPEQAREEESEKEQCNCSAEWVGNHSQHAVIIGGTGSTHHRATAEPGCDDCRRTQPHRQPSTGNNEFVDGVSPARGIYADHDHQHDIDANADKDGGFGAQPGVLLL